MNRLELLWSNLRSSFWFVPSLIFIAAIALAVGLVEADSGKARPWIEQWPRVFGSGAGGARGMLSTIAGSMMTVVGVTFSMTLVTLALASNQYTSRVLRNFMADRVTQVVLGVFGGIFIYCLIVLRTIRGGEEAYVPSLAVTFGVVLAIGGVSILIYFIHHIATAIQASSIIAALAGETLASIDRQFPEQPIDGEHPRGQPDCGLGLSTAEVGEEVTASCNGYIQSIDVDALLDLAEEHDAIVRAERGVGDFVVRGARLASVISPQPLPERLEGRVAAAFNIFRFRTIEQDVGLGIRQIADIALRALSPGVNDTTTAVVCVDYLSAILAHAITRDTPPGQHSCGGILRVTTVERTFRDLLGNAFDEIGSSAQANYPVLARMLEALQTVGAATRDVERRRLVADYVSGMREMRDGIVSPRDRARYDAILDETRSALAP